MEMETRAGIVFVYAQSWDNLRVSSLDNTNFSSCLDNNDENCRLSSGLVSREV